MNVFLPPMGWNSWNTFGGEISDRLIVETARAMKEKGYHWGCEWDEGDGVYEKDVLNEKYGNGWFLYVLEGDQFTEYHQMSNGGAYIPKEYTITVLTNTDLKYKDNKASVNHSYKKAN